MRDFNPDHIPVVALPEHFRWPADPIDLEIGCGKGMHAIRYAQANPERQLIAIERTDEKFAGFTGRIANHQKKGIALTNLHALFGDAIAYLVHHFNQPEIFARIFILYPNPYPKLGQANKRFHFAPAMRVIVDALQRGGELTIATNEGWYAAEAATTLPQNWPLRLTSEQEFAASDLPWLPRTHFERKYLERGEKCYNLVFTKELEPMRVMND